MANNVYIGNRYVPVFADPVEWDNLRQYEPLTIVTYQGTAYTSKKTVPVGTALSNTEYWVVTGNYNAQVEQYRQEVVQVQSDLDALSPVVSGLSTRMTGAESAIDTLEEYEDNNVAIYLGNSYAQGVGSTSGTDGLFAKTKHLFKSAKLYADGGVGFLTYPNHTSTFETLLDQCIADTSVDKSKVTDIIILSAWGDTLALVNRGNSFDSDLANALYSFKTKVANNFTNPKLKIRVAFVEIRSQRNIPDTAIGTSLYQEPFNLNRHFENILEAAEIPYLGWIGWNCMMNSAYTSSDKYHPSDAGYKTLGCELIKALTGGFQYKPLSGKAAYKCPAFGSTAVGSYLVIQTPYESKLIFGQFSSQAGTTPAQYTSATYFVFSDDDLTKFAPVRLNQVVDYLGAIVCYLPTRETQYSIDVNFTMNVNQYGQVYLEGQSFETAISLANRSNNSFGIKEMTIKHWQ